MSTTLDYAKEYLAKGLSVIPIKPGSKVAAVKWQEFQTRKATEEEIRKWFGNGSGNGIGIVTAVRRVPASDPEKVAVTQTGRV